MNSQSIHILHNRPLEIEMITNTKTVVCRNMLENPYNMNQQDGQQPVNIMHDYTNCCLYRADPPDDDQQACSKHVEAYYWNKLIENSACCWFVLYETQISSRMTGDKPFALQVYCAHIIPNACLNLFHAGRTMQGMCAD
jgi:hypothetical protein